MQIKRAKTERDKRRITALLRYGRDTDHCRREALLALLNYDSSGECPPEHCCDVCDTKASDKLREEDTLLNFFKRNRRSYSLNEAIPVLAHAENIRWSEDETRRAVNELIAMNILRVLKGFFWKGRITMVTINSVIQEKGHGGKRPFFPVIQINARKFLDLRKTIQEGVPVDT
jgi:ATP-dependent DNA helicase RecQ